MKIYAVSFTCTLTGDKEYIITMDGENETDAKQNFINEDFYCDGVHTITKIENFDGEVRYEE